MTVVVGPSTQALVEHREGMADDAVVVGTDEVGVAS